VDRTPPAAVAGAKLRRQVAGMTTLRLPAPTAPGETSARCSSSAPYRSPTRRTAIRAARVRQRADAGVQRRLMVGARVVSARPSKATRDTKPTAPIVSPRSRGASISFLGSRGATPRVTRRRRGLPPHEAKRPVREGADMDAASAAACVRRSHPWFEAEVPSYRRRVYHGRSCRSGATTESGLIPGRRSPDPQVTSTIIRPHIGA
jgi:hypothetical protein